MNFSEALKTGKLVIRKVWENTNSAKNQVSIQLQQKIAIPEGSNSNAVLAFLQGIEDAGFTKPTVIVSAKADVVLAKGLEYLDYTTEDKAVLAENFFPWELGIQIVENLVQNPQSPNQEAKRNPQTGNILTLDGKRIYRHTYLVPVGTSGISHTFLTHNGEMPAASIEDISDLMNQVDQKSVEAKVEAVEA